MCSITPGIFSKKTPALLAKAYLTLDASVHEFNSGKTFLHSAAAPALSSRRPDTEIRSKC